MMIFFKHQNYEHHIIEQILFEIFQMYNRIILPYILINLVTLSAYQLELYHTRLCILYAMGQISLIHYTIILYHAYY